MTCLVLRVAATVLLRHTASGRRICITLNPDFSTSDETRSSVEFKKKSFFFFLRLTSEIERDPEKVPREGATLTAAAHQKR